MKDKIQKHFFVHNPIHRSDTCWICGERKEQHTLFAPAWPIEVQADSYRFPEDREVDEPLILAIRSRSSQRLPAR